MDVETRKKWGQQKLEGKGENQVLVRCEPYEKYCNIPNSFGFNIIVPTNYKISYLSATISTRIHSKI